MKATELAKRLSGMDLDDFPGDLTGEARRAGLVIVIGASKNTVEFHGAIEGEADVPEGGAIHIDAEGILPDADDVSEAESAAYYDRKRLSYLIDAEWNHHGFPWSFTTAIPHHRFVVTNDGARYCRGIVFDVQAIGGGGQ